MVFNIQYLCTYIKTLDFYCIALKQYLIDSLTHHHTKVIKIPSCVTALAWITGDQYCFHDQLCKHFWKNTDEMTMTMAQCIDTHLSNTVRIHQLMSNLNQNETHQF